MLFISHVHKPSGQTKASNLLFNASGVSLTLIVFASNVDINEGRRLRSPESSLLSAKTQDIQLRAIQVHAREKPCWLSRDRPYEDSPRGKELRAAARSRRWHNITQEQRDIRNATMRELYRRQRKPDVDTRDPHDRARLDRQQTRRESIWGKGRH